MTFMAVMTPRGRLVHGCHTGSTRTFCNREWSHRGGTWAELDPDILRCSICDDAIRSAERFA